MGYTDSMPYHTDFYPRPPRGGRPQKGQAKRLAGQISIHALREEGDVNSFGVATWLNIFLSTPSARRATRRQRHPQPVCTFLSTPSARRATSVALLSLSLYVEFLSTPSARRATSDYSVTYTYDDISIHALREEGDPSFLQ